MENIKVIIEHGIDKLPQCREIRHEVFINEQKFEHEFDDIDAYAYHELITIDGKPVATARIFKDKPENPAYHLGRVCVLKEYRGRDLGRMLIENMENYARKLGGTAIELSAQVRVKQFYAKLGYEEYGEEYLDEYCPHINMKKIL